MTIKVFSAPWCKACQPYKDSLTQAGIKFETVDLEKEPEQAQKCNIKSLPTTIFYDNDRIIGMFTTLVSPCAVQHFINRGNIE